MNPQLLALLTAIAWGVGGYFEKKGLHLGGLSPQMGITIRTTVGSENPAQRAGQSLGKWLRRVNQWQDAR